MNRITLVDRLALVTMFVAATAIPLASRSYAYALPSHPAPSARVALGNGGERLFFTTGPLGTSTVRVDVSASGEVLARKQVLDDGVFQSVREGMPASDVFALLGPPASKTRFNALGATSWGYHYRDTWGYLADFSVMVSDAGVVNGKFSEREGN